MLRTVTLLAVLLGAIPATASAAWTVGAPADDLLQVHRAPDGPVKMHMDHLTPLGRPASLLVVGSRTSESGQWLEVRLPVRPNGATGWVRKERVQLHKVPLRVVIDLSDRRLVVYRGSDVAMRTGVVIGKSATPTPLGLHALWQTLPGLAGSTAPYELHLTAHSNVLMTFMGGPGRVAIHGMRGSLVAPLGTAVSNGCIRVPDGPLGWMARQLPPGTPILIRR